MRNILTIVSILGSFSFACSVAQAQSSDIYMSFPDSNIVGESTTENHLGEIKVLAFSWNFTAEPGKKSETNATIDGLNLTKFVDTSTASLLSKAVIGENLGRVVIAIHKSGECPLLDT